MADRCLANELPLDSTRTSNGYSSSLPTCFSAEVHAPRSRKYHTRSRTGCLPCRKRHMKCDESLPTCVNCSDVGKVCAYPTPDIPLRERKKDAWLPGEQQPWVTQAPRMQLVPSRRANPFNTLPGALPFRSTELFHYFCNADATVDWDTSGKHDGLALAAQDPDALRSAILFAALHFTWKVGDMKNFECTFLFHKIEAMRHLNAWLKHLQPRLATACIREICTLTFTECCLGNVPAAETHIDGLMKFMDLNKPLKPQNRIEFGLEDELSNRYLLVTYNFLHGVKSRLNDNLQSTGCSGLDDYTDPAEAEHFIRTWYTNEADGALYKLRAMRLFPTFFRLPSEDTEFQDIDGFAMIECTREFTQMADLRKHKSSPLLYNGGPLNQIWLQGAATRLLLDMVNLHMQSMHVGWQSTAKTQPPKGFMVAWSGAVAALGLYLNVILGMWNAGQPMEDRLHRRILCIIKADLDREDYLIASHDTTALDFWFWRAFVGMFSIVKHQRLIDQRQSRTLRPIYEKLIQKWILITGLTQWKEARKHLELIVWPRHFDDEGLAREIWENATVALKMRPVI